MIASAAPTSVAARSNSPRSRDQLRIVQVPGDLQCLAEQLGRSLVVSHPEGHEPGIEAGLPAKPDIATR
jgi:hypothetical protein